MADSEISTSLSRPSRRDLFSAVVLAVGGTSFNSSAAAAPQDDGTTDAAVVAWRAWRVAHRRTLSLCRKQQRLESELVRTVGFPQVALSAAELPSPVWIGSLRQFDELAADLPSLRSRRAEVAAALRAHQGRWNDADRSIGYTVARREEAAASDDEGSRIEELFAADATSLRGVSVKLDVLIGIGADGAEGRHFPWPEMRRIRKNVARLVELQRQKPGALTALGSARDASAGSAGADARTLAAGRSRARFG